MAEHPKEHPKERPKEYAEVLRWTWRPEDAQKFWVKTKAHLKGCLLKVKIVPDFFLNNKQAVV